MSLYLSLPLFLAFVPVIIAQAVTSTPTDLAQLSADIASKYLRATDCSKLHQTCQPTLSSCAASVCGTCTDLGQKAINECCSLDSAPTACFISQLHTTGPNVIPSGATPSPIPPNTAPYGPLTNPGFLACQSISAYSSTCESLSPGFTTTTVFQFQAPCLCYRGTSWAPDVFDGYVQTCQSYLAVSTDVTALVDTAPCRGIGNVEASLSMFLATGGQTATTTGSSTRPPSPTAPTTGSNTGPPSPTASKAGAMGSYVVRISPHDF